ENLAVEGVPADRIRRVGNVMIDTLYRFLPLATVDRMRRCAAVEPGQFAVVTLHRPSNVDDASTFQRLLDVLTRISTEMPVVFPVHARTGLRMQALGVEQNGGGLHLIDPLGYIDFLSLTSRARIVLTDSGGLQEESTALGIPCLTLRENTERPVTVESG